MIYEWGYNKGEIADGLFCSEACARNTYADNLAMLVHGGPVLIEGIHAEDLEAEKAMCLSCSTLLKAATP